MRKIVFILAFIVPILALGQVTENIEVSKEMKRVSIHELEFPEISNPFEIKKEKYIFFFRDQIPTRTYRPLMVIDGIPKDSTTNINPSDIESISILQGAEAIALYGSPATDGVILISTTSETEYEATVLDPGFQRFLSTQQSKAFYSEAMLKSKNARMVIEWNSRHMQPTLYDPQIYEVNIDYNPKTDYGLDVEYTLYMFFRFMEKEHNIKLS